MNRDRIIAVGILAGAIASIFATRTGTVAAIFMWIFAGVAIAAFIVLPGSWYRRSLSRLRSGVLARLVRPPRLRPQRDQAQLAVAARWRFTTDGAAAPQVRRDVDRNIDHPSYMRPADSVPACVRIIALVPCGPLADAPDSQELRDRFLAWLAQTPAMSLIGDLRPGQGEVTWKPWATPRRSNLRGDLTGEDQAQVPVASAVLELPSDSMRLAGTDPRYAELILHVDLPATDFARGLPDWRRRIIQAVSMPGELARFLHDLGLGLPGEPPAQVGVLLRGRHSLTEIVSPGNIPALPASSTQIVSEFIGLAIAVPDGRTAEETAGQMVLDLSERDLHLNGSQAEMSGETIPGADSASAAPGQPGADEADHPLTTPDAASRKIISALRRALSAQRAAPVDAGHGPQQPLPDISRPRRPRPRRGTALIAGIIIVLGGSIAAAALIHTGNHAGKTAARRPQPRVTMPPPQPLRALGQGQIGYQYVTAVAFNLGGTTLATGDSGGSTDLWDLATLKRVATLKDPGTSGVSSVAFSKTGTTLATGDLNGSTYLWSLIIGRVITTLPDPFGSAINSVAFSGNDTTLAAGDSNGFIYIWALATRKVIAELQDPGSRGVSSVAFSKTGTSLAAGDINGRTYVWSLTTDRITATLPDPGSNGVNSIAFSPHTTTIAAADGNGTTYIWSLASQRVAAAFPNPDALAASAVAFSPDGAIVAIGDEYGYAYLWDLAARQKVAMLPGGVGGRVSALTFSPDGNILAVGNYYATTYLWRMTGAPKFSET